MTERTKSMLSLLKKREYRRMRETQQIDIIEAMKGLNEYEAITFRLKAALENEKPVIHENDIFGFNRSQTYLPKYEVPGYIGNMTPNYGGTIKRGFRSVLDEVEEKLVNAEGETKDFYVAVKEEVEAVLALCARYQEAAEKQGNVQLSQALKRVPEYGATSLYEACLFQKIIIFALRCVDVVHVTLGRFDQYMYEFYQADAARGMSREELLEIVELYFISLNMDTDLYRGMQLGDNGQSMVLGGFDLEGNSMFNELSALCMDASLDLNVIDPKINLRVGKNTPDEMYEYATKLTKQGMGFPQYCNDDVVVPGLIGLGYEPQDAVDYTVAACWEFIIPGCGLDVNNRGSMNFPLVVSNTIKEHLMEADTFDSLMEYVKENLQVEIDARVEKYYGDRQTVNPLLSVFLDGCLEKGIDGAKGGTKYYNMGCHGAGLSNASDALAAVKKVIYDEQSVSKEELLEALEKNFEGFVPLRNKLMNCPKMGNNDEYVDDISQLLMEAFANGMNGKPNGVGGVWRAGTGSALDYVRGGRVCPATADGRLAGEPFACSFSPAPNAKIDGPLSVIMSFSKFDLKKVINGGPLTMEIHDTVFRNQEGEKKVAALVKAAMQAGIHQMQINSVNRDVLLDAQKHPENHANLIVRVWGWSGYFCELDPAYQNHIINRTEFMV